MYILNRGQFDRRLKERGYRTIGRLAQVLGIHRNTLQYYLSGRRVLPVCFEKLMSALEVTPSDILIEEKIPEKPVTDNIAPLVDELHAKHPELTFVLFGSRAKGTANKYSDFDIGVYSTVPIPHEVFRSIRILADDLASDFPFFVDLVNLQKASEEFLKVASQGWIFLTGRLKDWGALQKMVQK